MKITVIGPGAMGLLFASRLGLIQADVTLLDIFEHRAKAINKNGVILADGDTEQVVKVPDTIDPAVLAQTDLAIVCVKAYDTGTVAQTLAAHLRPQGRALTLQNGAGNVETLASALGPERVLGGITSEGANSLDDGRVRHAGKGETHLGPAKGPVDAFCQETADLFTRAGFVTSTRAGVQDLIWTKLLINVGINPLTAVLGVPNGRLLDLPAAKEIMALAVNEAMEVGLSSGVDFLHEDMLAAVHGVAEKTAQNISSMLQDVRAKRRTEIDFICGTVVRDGARLNVPTPVNHTLTLLVKALEEKSS